MKNWFAYILIFITAAGSFIPCCRVDDCCSDQIISDNKEHDNHQTEGACSPFFACATCSASIELSKAIQIHQLFAVKQIHYEQIIQFNPTTYISSFWQPPRSC